jgi:hypothetical protein
VNGIRERFSDIYCGGGGGEEEEEEEQQQQQQPSVFIATGNFMFR